MQSNFWKKLKKPIIVAAPMSGVTDDAFRLMLLKYGRPDVFWTEFVSVEGLFSKGRESCLEVLKFSPKEHPIVAQVFGSDPSYFKKAASEIEELGFDGIDINMGCPDRAIEKKGSGAALIKDVELAKEIIRATKKGTKIPVSVKTRLGYNENQINEWIVPLLKEKVAVLTIHFRTRKELYRYPAQWELAKEIVKLRDLYAPETLIIGNGDVKSLKEAQKLAKENNLDGIMIGRATMGNPWFFSNKSPDTKERLNAIIEHIEIVNDPKRFSQMKKHFHAYTKGFNGAKELRDSIMEAKNYSEVKKLIEKFLL
ncbi:MAG: tRNA-dihydrouridine synthase [Candidatus Pacebacteria bacterium]|nr:tRNA-dihydrouridine synthase [Candidatus Paceibacterota bacterium]MDD4738266.1 tRNA-dihydrouridine synthase [Candidatus Paceibacterota bacterium]